MMAVDPAQTVHTRARRLIALQCGVALVVAAAFFVSRGRWEALSAGYGSLIAVFMTLLLSQGMALASKAKSMQQSQIVLYAGAAVRFLLVLALFAFGIAGLKLEPLATVLGFIAAQLIVPFTALRAREH
jgi:F0F1-type ATP synthase assembly protein I